MKFKLKKNLEDFNYNRLQLVPIIDNNFKDGANSPHNLDLFTGFSKTKMQQSSEKQLIKTKSISVDKNDKDVAALRAELELEIKNKKQCAYETYECTQLTLDGYKYCLKHILQDKNAPYKQCSYVYASNGKRCQLPAPKIEKKDISYCNEHAVKTTLTKNRQNSRYPPPQTAEVLLYSLGHYVKKPKNRALPSSQSDDFERADEPAELKTTRSLNPFRDIDANNVSNSSCSNILDFCSESDSDVDAATLATVWHDYHNDSSDDESIDSEQEDVLKHTNVYTAEEITSIAKEKLLKLQSLYIEQYRHLQHVLREKKRKYYQSLKREKETCCNIYNQVRENPKEQRLYKKLKAYNRYHKTHGIEAILSKQLHDQRAKITEGLPTKPTNFTKCSYTEGGVKCGERVLPLAKHCRKHILEDTNQVLFKVCGKTRADIECKTPIEAIFDDSCCRLHMDIPSIRSYNQIRKNSESDFEDSFENMESLLLDQSDLSTSSNVKTELIDYKPSIDDMKTLPSILFEESSSDFDNKPYDHTVMGESSNSQHFNNDNRIEEDNTIKLESKENVQE